MFVLFNQWIVSRRRSNMIERFHRCLSTISLRTFVSIHYWTTQFHPRLADHWQSLGNSIALSPDSHVDLLRRWNDQLREFCHFSTSYSSRSRCGKLSSRRLLGQSNSSLLSSLQIQCDSLCFFLGQSSLQTDHLLALGHHSIFILVDQLGHARSSLQDISGETVCATIMTSQMSLSNRITVLTQFIAPLGIQLVSITLPLAVVRRQRGEMLGSSNNFVSSFTLRKNSTWQQRSSFSVVSLNPFFPSV